MHTSSSFLLTCCDKPSPVNVEPNVVWVTSQVWDAQGDDGDVAGLVIQVVAAAAVGGGGGGRRRSDLRLPDEFGLEKLRNVQDHREG